MCIFIYLLKTHCCFQNMKEEIDHKKLVKNNVYSVGIMDWELESFHGADYSINHGSSQNAYLIREEKTVLIGMEAVFHGIYR